MTFVAPNLAWGEARGGSIPHQWGCDRRATKTQAKLGATLRAAVFFGPGGVARSARSLQIHWRDMRVARALPGPKTPRRKRHRIYALDHFARESSLLRVRNVGCILVSAAVLSILPLAANVEAGEVSSQAYLQNDTKSGVDAALWLESSLKRI